MGLFSERIPDRGCARGATDPENLSTYTATAPRRKIRTQVPPDWNMPSGARRATTDHDWVYTAARSDRRRLQRHLCCPADNLGRGQRSAVVCKRIVQPIADTTGSQGIFVNNDRGAPESGRIPTTPMATS